MARRVHEGQGGDRFERLAVGAHHRGEVGEVGTHLAAGLLDRLQPLPLDGADELHQVMVRAW
jgi:hypothetical protein